MFIPDEIRAALLFVPVSQVNSFETSVAVGQKAKPPKCQQFKEFLAIISHVSKVSKVLSCQHRVIFEAPSLLKQK